MLYCDSILILLLVPLLHIMWKQYTTEATKLLETPDAQTPSYITFPSRQSLCVCTYVRETDSGIHWDQESTVTVAKEVPSPLSPLKPSSPSYDIAATLPGPISPCGWHLLALATQWIWASYQSNEEKGSLEREKVGYKKRGGGDWVVPNMYIFRLAECLWDFLVYMAWCVFFIKGEELSLTFCYFARALKGYLLSVYSKNSKCRS